MFEGREGDEGSALSLDTTADMYGSAGRGIQALFRG